MPSLYDVLGVDRRADTNEIRKAYLRLSKTHHPDKGGDAEEFKKINRANEILTDEGRRAMYDQTGQEEEGGPGPGFPGGFPGGGFPGGGMPGGPFSFPFDMGHMFGNMFGGGGGPGLKRQKSYQKQAKGPPKLHEMPISLKDFYYGTSMKLHIDRQKFCESCKGEGSAEFKSCAGCSGTGTRQTMVMMGPGMQGIMRGPCPDCLGEGRTVSKQCEPCTGNGFLHEQKVLDIRIEPGMLPRHTIIFPKACSDQKEYMEPGDVHIVLQEADAEDDCPFVRTGNDLGLRIEISLLESLVGCSRKLTGHPGYPEGLPIDLPCGLVNGQVIPIDRVGMPIRGTIGYGAVKVTVAIKVSDSEKGVLEMKKDELRGLFSF